MCSSHKTALIGSHAIFPLAKSCPPIALKSSNIKRRQYYTIMTKPISENSPYFLQLHICLSLAGVPTAFYKCKISNNAEYNGTA
jgi:hypothetical protein